MCKRGSNKRTSPAALLPAAASEHVLHTIQMSSKKSRLRQHGQYHRMEEALTKMMLPICVHTNRTEPTMGESGRIVSETYCRWAVLVVRRCRLGTTIAEPEALVLMAVAVMQDIPSRRWSHLRYHTNTFLDTMIIVATVVRRFRVRSLNF